MNMNSYSKTLTLSEQKLLERFLQYDESKLTPAVQSILEDYNTVFFSDIFSIIVEDVLQVLALNEWTELSYKKIIFTAKSIWEASGCFFPANQYFLFALPIVWIAHCCRYKNEVNILDSELKPHSIISDSKQLEQSLSAHFFNFFSGPFSGKGKKLERYMHIKYGHSYGRMNSDHLMNFQTLLHFLSVTGFSYELPEK